MDPDSVAAAVYVVVPRRGLSPRRAPSRARGLRSPFADEPPGTFQPLELRIWVDARPGCSWPTTRTLLPPGEYLGRRARGRARDGVGVLRTVLGDDADAWRWGALHRRRARASAVGRAPGVRRHALDPPAVEMGGEWDTVFCAAHPAGFGFGVTSASVARYVFDLGGLGAERWIVPLGRVGRRRATRTSPTSSADGREGELVPMRYSWPAIDVGGDVERAAQPGAALSSSGRAGRSRAAGRSRVGARAPARRSRGSRRRRRGRSSTGRRARRPSASRRGRARGARRRRVTRRTCPAWPRASSPSSSGDVEVLGPQRRVDAVGSPGRARRAPAAQSSNHAASTLGGVAVDVERRVGLERRARRVHVGRCAGLDPERPRRRRRRS